MCMNKEKILKLIDDLNNAGAAPPCPSCGKPSKLLLRETPQGPQLVLMCPSMDETVTAEGGEGGLPLGVIANMALMLAFVDTARFASELRKEHQEDSDANYVQFPE